MRSVDDVMTALLDLTESLRPDEPRGDLLGRMSSRVVALLKGADAVTITVFDEGEPSTVAATDDRLVAIDEAQYRTDDGPCMRAIRTHSIVHSDLTATAAQWPNLTAVAAQFGVRRALSCPLFVSGEHPSDVVGHRSGGYRLSGAMNVWSYQDEAFDPPESTMIAMFTAAMSSVILTATRWELAEEHARNLRAALASRDVIATAKGIVMVRLGVDKDEAFAWLTEVSQRTNQKLYDLAVVINANPGVVTNA